MSGKLQQNRLMSFINLQLKVNCPKCNAKYDMLKTDRNILFFYCENCKYFEITSGSTAIETWRNKFLRGY